jgi:DNA replication ATP-dependent helicase Dna2
LSDVKHKATDTDKNYIIGVTAFTRAAIENLLGRILTIQEQHNKTNDFNIIYLADDLRKKHPSGITKCKARKLPSIYIKNTKPTVIGGTVWDWFNVRKEYKSGWAGCNIMIIDEGSQVHQILFL